MKDTIRLILLAVILSSLSISTYSSPVWQRKVINYERNQYKAGFQNWMIAQSEAGWIYCANSHGLLEFDGTSWYLYSIRNKLLRSVKIIDKVIYVGGSTEFGFFEPDDIGKLSYRSISHKAKDWTGEVWNILTEGEKIYFLSDKHINIYDKKTTDLKTIDVGNKIDCSTLVGDVLYIGTPEGVFCLKNDILSYLPVSETLKRQKLVSILPYEDKLLVTTARFGLYLMDDKGIQKMQSVADGFIANNQLFSSPLSRLKISRYKASLGSKTKTPLYF